MWLNFKSHLILVHLLLVHLQPGRLWVATILNSTGSRPSCLEARLCYWKHAKVTECFFNMCVKDTDDETYLSYKKAFIICVAIHITNTYWIPAMYQALWQKSGIRRLKKWHHRILMASVDYSCSSLSTVKFYICGFKNIWNIVSVLNMYRLFLSLFSNPKQYDIATAYIAFYVVLKK